MVDMFEILQRVSGGSTIPEWQSTHPDPGNRIEATEARLKTVTKPLDSARVNQDEFLAIIDGMVFGDDPRKGYFTGTTFIHPSTRLCAGFPARLANQEHRSGGCRDQPAKGRHPGADGGRKRQPRGRAEKVHGQRESAGWNAAQHYDQRQSGDPGAVFAQT
jgi:hypothetical protein